MDVLVKSGTFPSVGRCIYCGTTEPPLRDEHIIPFGLQGDYVLPNASCDACAGCTKKFEQACLRTMLGPARIHLDIRTRRKKERPTHLHTHVFRPDGTLEAEAVAIADHPFLMTLPIFSPPRLISGDSNRSTQSKMRLWIRHVQGDLNSRIGRLGNHGVQIRQVLPVVEFFKMLSKIAHAWTVAVVGLDKFEPILPDFILGRFSKYNGLDLVGSGNEKQMEGEEMQLHRIVAWEALKDGLNEKPLIAVAIQLFACLNAPIYTVAVGWSRTSALKFYLPPQ